ncbi:MAG: glutathione-disulfide reductase [Pseudomonadota bacterium]
MSDSFDLVVIGGGSGGVAAARRAALHGAKVALIERDRLGGTCVIRGCVPKKLMMYASRFSNEIRDAAAYGWSLPGASFDLAAWQDRKTAEIKRLEGIYRDMLINAKVAVFAGYASLLSLNSVQVDQHVLQAKNILIATGGRPSMHAFPGLDQAMTSNDILDLRVLPRRLGVVGAGYIGLEFASIMAGLGSQVSLFFRDELPMRGFDRSLRERLKINLKLQGIHVESGSRIQKIAAGASGNTTSIITEAGTQEFDAVLNASGRTPNTGGMGLEGLGMRLRENGAVIVDEFSESTVKGIFAIGDVTDRKNLTPVAIAEGRAFADNQYQGTQRTVNHASAATAMFTNPPLGTVGLSEEEAAKQGRLRIYEADFRPMKTAFAGLSNRTYMKLVVWDSSDKIAGMHMLGEDAPEIIQSLAVAYTMGASKADFDRTIAVHPTAAEELMLMREPSRIVEQSKS